MKFIFVVGGSYRSFYINKINSIKNVDLIIFNNGVFSDINYCVEDIDTIVFVDEIKELNKLFKCPVIVCCNINRFGNKYNAFVLCVNQKISIIPTCRNVYLYIDKELVLISNKIYKQSYAFVNICITDYNDKTSKKHISLKNRYFICGNKEVLKIINGKICRKFKKCCEFILKKNK